MPAGIAGDLIQVKEGTVGIPVDVSGNNIFMFFLLAKDSSMHNPGNQKKKVKFFQGIRFGERSETHSLKLIESPGSKKKFSELQ